MLDFLTSGVGGVLSGLLGTGLQKVMEYKTEKLKAQSELDKRKLDIELMQAEAASRIKVAEIDGNARIESADAEAFSASFNLEPKIYSEGTQKTPAQVWLLLLLDVFRGSIRPMLTTYLVVLTTLLYFKTAALLTHEIILPGMAYELVQEIINTVLYLTVTVITWWFGVRGNRPPKK